MTIYVPAWLLLLPGWLLLGLLLAYLVGWLLDVWTYVVDRLVHHFALDRELIRQVLRRASHQHPYHHTAIAGRVDRRRRLRIGRCLQRDKANPAAGEEQSDD